MNMMSEASSYNGQTLAVGTFSVHIPPTSRAIAVRVALKNATNYPKIVVYGSAEEYAGRLCDLAVSLSFTATNLTAYPASCARSHYLIPPPMERNAPLGRLVPPPPPPLPPLPHWWFKLQEPWPPIATEDYDGDSS